MCDDNGTGLAEIFVASGMVSVPVRVHNKPHRALIDGPDGLKNLLRQRGKLVVDEKHAVLTGRQTDVTALAQEHVHAVGYGYDLDDNVGGFLRPQRDRKGKEASID